MTLDQTKLIESIEGICPNNPTKAKEIRINDAIEKNGDTYLLWTYTCDHASTGLSTIMISIKHEGNWNTYTVSSERGFYIDRNYLGAPIFVDLNESGTGIVWADFTNNPAKPDLMIKIFDDSDANLLTATQPLAIASSTECHIGNIMPVSNSSGVFLIYLTNNGGANFCNGDLYATQFLSGNWTTPELIKASIDVPDLYKDNNLAITSTGEAYICYTSRISYESLDNQVSVVKLVGGVPTIEFLRSYPDIEINSAHYCSIEIDQFDQPHLLVAEIAWIKSTLDGEMSVRGDLNTINFREFKIVESTWQESVGSLDDVNSKLDDSFTYATFCNKCQETMNLIVTSELNSVKLYEYGSDKKWDLTRDFNEGYDQDVQNIREVWGNSSSGYTFLINNFASVLSGTFGSQKGHFIDVKPTFSPPSVNKLLYSDSVYEVASKTFLNEFQTIYSRLTSRDVLKIGNSLISMWEDLGSESIPPRTIIIERSLKENPSCTDSNFAPGRPQELVASSVYTTAILSFVQSQCGSTPAQATVEVKNVNTGAIHEVTIMTPRLRLEIPNLEPGNTYAFKVKLTNDYGTSNFTNYSNLVMATRPVVQAPQETVLATEEILTSTNKTDTEIIPEEPKPSSILKINEKSFLKLKSLGLTFATQKFGQKPPSSISAVFSAQAKLSKPVKINSNRYIEINAKSFSSERVMAHLVIGKRVVYLGYVTPSADLVLKLPAVSFKPGRYLFKFTSLSGKLGFISINAK